MFLLPQILALRQFIARPSSWESMQEYMVKTVSRWLMGLTRLQSTIDCLLKSKFVGYTANFTENLYVIIDGADVFFHQKKFQFIVGC